ETTRLAPTRRRSRGQVEMLAAATESIDLAVRNTRVLARSAIRAIELREHVPDVVVDSIRDLAAATSALEAHLEAPAPDSPARGGARVRGARADLEHGGQRDRRPGPRDGDRPAAGVGPVARRGDRAGALGAGGAGGVRGAGTAWPLAGGSGA